MFQYFVQRGFAVLAPNVRGSTGYGRVYTHLDDVERRMDSVADLGAAWHWLVDSGAARHDAIAIMGGSYGGFMVLAALVNQPDLWAAGVDTVGIANFVTFLENTGAYRSESFFKVAGLNCGPLPSWSVVPEPAISNATGGRSTPGGTVSTASMAPTRIRLSSAAAFMVMPGIARIAITQKIFPARMR